MFVKVTSSVSSSYEYGMDDGSGKSRWQCDEPIDAMPRMTQIEK
jgi:hypothetical protein